MGVVSHNYGWLGGGSGWQPFGTKSERVGHMLGYAVALPECEVKTLMKLNHTGFRVRSSR